MKAHTSRLASYNTISLFSGAGGLDIGFSRAGFRICLAVEKDKNCAATLRANGSHCVWQADISDERLVTPRRILRKAGLRAGEVGLVIAGPPCQPFSCPGKRRGLEDPRGQLVYHFCRLVAGLRPKVFVMENVPGILTKQMRVAIDLIQEVLGAEGYRIEVSTLNAAAFGVPQMRERTFVVGWKACGNFYFPKPTHYLPGHEYDRDNNVKIRKYRTVRDALRGLPPAKESSERAKRVAMTIKERNRQWYGK